MDAPFGDALRVIRRFRSEPRWAAAVLTTLVLGVGANTAVFGLANWLELRPVPGVRDQARLVVAEFRDSTGEYRIPSSYPNLADLRAQVPAFAGLAGTTDPIPLAIVGDGVRPRFLDAAFVADDYFDVLGVHLGPGGGAERWREAARAGTLAVVISDRLWRSRFGADRRVVGRYLQAKGVRIEVVAVAPADFHGIGRLDDVDLWIPGRVAPEVTSQLFRTGVVERRGAGIFAQLVGRLAPGATVRQAEAQLRTAAANLVASYPRENVLWRSPRVYAGIGVPPAQRASVRRATLVLGGIAGLVLLITCANVANLLLFRALRRRTEWAVRRALGASAGRVVRAHVAESLVMALVATPLAVLFGLLVMRAFRGTMFPGLGTIDPIHFDWRVAIAALALSIGAGLASGLAPVVADRGGDILAGLKAGGQRASRRRGWLRDGLAAIQLALSLSLLVVTLLLVQTVRHLRAVPIGFAADSIVTFAISPTLSGYSPDASLNVIRETLQRVQAIPGVSAAALSLAAPFSRALTLDGHVKAGAAPGDSGVATIPAWVSPTYFRTMGIPLLAGRAFEDGEMFMPLAGKGERGVILSRALARRLFGRSDPVGRTVRTDAPDPPERVVGVVADTHWRSLTDGNQAPVMYFPLPNGVANIGATFLVRTAMPAAALDSAVQGVLAAVAPTVPAFDLAPMRQGIDRTTAEERVLARLLTVFTLLAVFLASVGVYSVVAYSARERTREVGIRVALGATPGRVLALVGRQGVILAAVGITAGGGGAIGLSRVVASRLYGVTALDPEVYAVAAMSLLLLAAIATLVPAWRATRVDPAAVLRSE